MDGHPASSKFDLFEAFVANIIQLAKSNKDQWAETAIFVTVDEGGGYYDSGFIQPVDFFGTGPRIPGDRRPFRSVQLRRSRQRRIEIDQISACVCLPLGGCCVGFAATGRD